MLSHNSLISSINRVYASSFDGSVANDVTASIGLKPFVLGRSNRTRRIQSRLTCAQF